MPQYLPGWDVSDNEALHLQLVRASGSEHVRDGRSSGGITSRRSLQIDFVLTWPSPLRSKKLGAMVLFAGLYPFGWDGGLEIMLGDCLARILKRCFRTVESVDIELPGA